MVLVRGAIATSVVLATLAACAGEDDPFGAALQNEEAVKSIKSLTTFSNDACKPIPDLPDDFLGALAGCCGGKGRCVPDGPQLGSQGDQLQACSTGGKCVPTDLLELSKKPLRTCKTLTGDGVCFPTCIDAVDQLKLILPQSSCEADERCVPCINPTDKKPTGICDLGKTPKPKNCPPEDETPTKEQCANAKKVVDVSKLKACDGGHCVPKSAAGSQADQLDPCADPNYLCAPDAFIATGGLTAPTQCNSLGGAEGRCVSAKIKQVADQADRLPKEGCQADEVCAPCFDPVTGEKLPTCTIGCDTGPKKPPFVFAKCKGEAGRCVPKSVIGGSGLVNLALSQDTCQAEEVCAPLSAVDRTKTPVGCTSKALLGQQTGVCLENVFSGVVSSLGGIVGVSQGSCQPDFDCVPCSLGKGVFKGCPATP